MGFSLDNRARGKCLSHIGTEARGLPEILRKYLEEKDQQKAEGAVVTPVQPVFRKKPKNLKALPNGAEPRKSCRFPVIGVGR
jgi:hypothetical protein